MCVFARAPLAWSGKAETRHRCALVLCFRHFLIKGSELSIQLVEHEFVVTGTRELLVVNNLLLSPLALRRARSFTDRRSVFF